VQYTRLSFGDMSDPKTKQIMLCVCSAKNIGPTHTHQGRRVPRMCPGRAIGTALRPTERVGSHPEVRAANCRFVHVLGAFPASAMRMVIANVLIMIINTNSARTTSATSTRKVCTACKPFRTASTRNKKAKGT